MSTNSDRVLAYLASQPDGKDDDQIATALGIDRIQVNQLCRRLATAGAVHRGKTIPGAKIRNWLTSPYEVAEPTAPILTESASEAPSTPPLERFAGPLVWLEDARAAMAFAYTGTANLSEDQIKMAVKQALEAHGWRTEIRWGHDRGIDIDAIRGTERFVLEAKGEGLSDQVRGNYFDGALGELIRRMDTQGVRYGLALSAHRRFTSLVARLPLWIRHRLDLWFFFVRPAPSGLEVGIFPPEGKRDSL